jgi:hypothetical protein
MTEQSLETEDANYLYIKLANGDNIMCTTFSDIAKLDKMKYLPIIDPIQIFSFKIPQNGVFIEKYIMQTWTPFSSDNSTVIPLNNIVFVGRLKEIFIEKYIDYITDPSAQQLVEETGAGDAEDEEDLDNEDDFIEELTNQLKKEKKTWYH